MAIKSSTTTLSTSSALVYRSTNGHAEAPQTLLVKNVDTTITAYVGGEDVTSANGMEVKAGEVLAVDLISGDEVYMIAASGTPEMRLLYNRV